MKTKLILAATLLLAFGTMKAQDTLTTAPRKADTTTNEDLHLRMNELLRELGITLEQMSDSVDWEQFERDMEKWGAEMEKWGRKMEKIGDRIDKKYGDRYEYNYDYQYEWPERPDRPEPKRNRPPKCKPNEKSPEKKSLLLDAHWNGFEAGLNMLFNTQVNAVNPNNGAQGLEIRPLRSWYFGFNIADVGIAFNKKHTIGLFTGVGIGWNNYSWNNDITVEYDPDNVVYAVVPIVRVICRTSYLQIDPTL